MILSYFNDVETTVPIIGDKADRLKEAYKLGQSVAKNKIEFKEETKKLICELKKKTFRINKRYLST